MLNLYLPCAVCYYLRKNTKSSFRAYSLYYYTNILKVSGIKILFHVRFLQNHEDVTVSFIIVFDPHDHMISDDEKHFGWDLFHRQLPEIKIICVNFLFK